MKRFSILLLCLLAACSSDPKVGETYGHWQVATKSPHAQDGLCYAGTAPLTPPTAAEGRKAPYLMITRRPSGKIEISASAGAPYKKGTPVKLVIDDSSYRLFFKDSVAWAKNDVMDQSIIKALKTAKTVEVQSTIVPHTKVVDHYSVDGFAQALKRVRALCP